MTDGLSIFKKRNLLIIGAGASVSYGYPTAQDLRRFICSGFKDFLLKNIPGADEEEIRDLTGEAERLCNAFKKSSNPSIDVFISRRPEFATIGKLAIALKIVYDESKNSGLFRERTTSGDDWYTYLFRRLITNYTKPLNWQSLDLRNFRIITFNYDRSLEHFFYESFAHSFPNSVTIETGTTKTTIPSVSISEWLRQHITHVYGQIDKLHWQDQQGTSYGKARINYDNLGRYSRNILLIDEAPNVFSRIVSGIQDSVTNAHRIFFLGFGYHPENLKILGIPDLLGEEQEIYGTALGFTSREKDGVEALLKKNQSEVTLEIKMNCTDLLRNYF